MKNQPTLPDDYVVPSTSKYVKLQSGENRIRVLGSAIFGMEGWQVGADDKRYSVRRPMGEPFVMGDVEDVEKIKHFWALPVWNYTDKRVQVFEPTQKTIQKKLRALSKNKDWGDLQGYDVIINREGELMETEYDVIAVPPKELDAAIIAAWEAVKPTFDLNRLFDNGDPFLDDSTETEMNTPASPNRGERAESAAHPAEAVKPMMPKKLMDMITKAISGAKDGVTLTKIMDGVWKSELDQKLSRVQASALSGMANAKLKQLTETNPFLDDRIEAAEGNDPTGQPRRV